MTGPVNVTEYKHSAFPLWLASTAAVVFRLFFAESESFNSFKQHFHSAVVKCSPLLQQLGVELDAYFDGSSKPFTTVMDISTGTQFQQSVWKALLTIPHGTVLTYGQVAKQIGKPRAVRAVGSANGANPLPVIIPCHRVVAAGGNIGGYGSGVQIKRALLDLEGYSI